MDVKYDIFFIGHYLNFGTKLYQKKAILARNYLKNRQIRFNSLSFQQ